MRRSSLGPWGMAVLGTTYVLIGVGCGDNPFDIEWTASPDTALVYSLSRPELNLPTAYDLVVNVGLFIQSPGVTGQWDFALDEQDGDLVLLPPGVFGIESTAEITSLGRIPFLEATRAPTDTTLYVADAPVKLELGTVYAFRTHLGGGPFGETCFFYAKLEPLAIDVAAGTLEFVFDRNPFCADPALVPEN